MKDFFRNYVKPQPDKALFREGMRQLKLPGMVYAIVMLLFQVGMELDHGSYYGFWTKQYTLANPINVYLDEIADITAILSTMFIVGAMFYVSHLLRSGRARDFYCATPHSLGTVWGNFAASVYAWCLIGMAAPYLLCTVVMGFMDYKAIGFCLQAFLGNAAFALMVFGVMMLAVTLTGRILNALITAAGIAFLPSALWGAFHASLNYYYNSLFLFIRYPEGLSCPDPFSVFLDSTELFRLSLQGGRSDGFALFAGWHVIVYCLLVGAAEIALAMLFASVRTGDTTGRPFINREAHLLSLFSVMLTVYCCAAGLFTVMLDYKVEYFKGMVFNYISIILVTVIGLTVAFWVCELLLTFDIKRAHRALKYLPIPAAIALAVTGCGYLHTTAEFTTTVDPAEVASFSLVRNSDLNDDLAIFRLSSTYGRTVTEDTRFENRAVIEYVASRINEFVALYQDNPKKAFEQSENWYYLLEEESTEPNPAPDATIAIRLYLKNGRAVTRAIRFDKEHADQLAQAILSDKAFMKQFLALPDSSKLNLDMYSTEGMDAADLSTIYDSFLKEYSAMTDEQKLEYLKEILYSDYERNIYYDYGYQDPAVSRDAAADGDPSAPEAVVSESDAVNRPVNDYKLVSKTCEPGDYIITHCDLTGEGGLTGDYVFRMETQGYAERHLYDTNYLFEQTIRIDRKTFPETHALIVRTCNAGMTDLIKTLTAYNSDGFRGNGYVELSADYYAADSEAHINYDLVMPSYLQWSRDEYRSYWEDAYWDEEAEEYKTNEYKTVEVDSNAMVAKLLADAEATGDTVDFSKPYCVLSIHGDSGKKNTRIHRQIFIQTELGY